MAAQHDAAFHKSTNLHSFLTFQKLPWGRGQSFTHRDDKLAAAILGERELQRAEYTYADMRRREYDNLPIEGEEQPIRLFNTIVRDDASSSKQVHPTRPTIRDLDISKFGHIDHLRVIAECLRYLSRMYNDIGSSREKTCQAEDSFI